MNQELISVIIPVYNMEKYLGRCLNSIVHNSYSNLDIICINDGSSDRSLQILECYKKDDSRIRIINQENMGLSAARNAGLNLAKGDWIAFIDSDDWVHKQYFELLLCSGQETNVDIIISGTLITSNDNLADENINAAKAKAITLSISQLEKKHQEYAHSCGRLYKNTYIKNHRFIHGLKYYEDYIFNTLLYDSTTKLALLDLPLYYYYSREDSIVHTAQGYQKLSLLPLALDSIKNNWNDFSPYQRTQIADKLNKLILSSRLIDDGASYYKETKKISKALFHDIRYMDQYLTVKYKLIFSLLRQFPALYKAYRLYDDPTMKEYLQRNQNKSFSS